MSVAASQIMTLAGYLLNDQSAVRWTYPELASWIGDGQNAIVLADPSSASANVTMALQSGTWQQISSSYLSVLRLIRNIASVGPPRVGGRAIRVTTRQSLDAASPYWHSTTYVPFGSEVRNFIFDEDDPKSFYVYPGNDGTGIVEALLVQDLLPISATGLATELSSYGQNIGLPDSYAPALVDYVVYRALSKDAPGGSLAVAQSHFKAFAAAIGIEEQSAGASSPNAKTGTTPT